MNRLFIILGALAAAGTVAWAWLRESPPSSGKPNPAAVEAGVRDCCRPSENPKG